MPEPGLLVCLDGVSGIELWATQLPGRVESSASMTACGEAVVVGCYDGHLYFVCFTTGAILWAYPMGDQVQ